MKHSKGIDLAPDAGAAGAAGQLIYTTLGALPEWYTLGCRCRSCGHQANVDRWELSRRFGTGVYIGSLGSLIRCSKCRKRGDADWLVGKLPRD